MLGMNEATFMTEKELAEVNRVVSLAGKYMDMGIDIETHMFTLYNRPDGVTITIKETGAQQKFLKSPCTEPWGSYMNRIKTFLFDSMMDYRSGIQDVFGHVVNKWDVLTDIKNIIRKEGKEELRYTLPDDNTLVIEVLCPSSGDSMEIAVERLDEHGNTVESATDDYDCKDDILIAMIENAILA